MYCIIDNRHSKLSAGLYSTTARCWCEWWQHTKVTRFCRKHDHDLIVLIGIHLLFLFFLRQCCRPHKYVVCQNFFLTYRSYRYINLLCLCHLHQKLILSFQLELSTKVSYSGSCYSDHHRWCRCEWWQMYFLIIKYIW